MSSRKSVNDSASSSRSNRNSSKEESGSEQNVVDDKLFEPSLEMMVNDFDDESTLEQEEKMASTESQDPNAELNSLQRESDMPIEELLALYNCVTPPKQTFSSTSSSSSRRRSKTSRNAGIDKSLLPPPETPKTIEESAENKDEPTEETAIAETDSKPAETPAKEDSADKDNNEEPTNQSKSEEDHVKATDTEEASKSDIKQEPIETIKESTSSETEIQPQNDEPMDTEDNLQSNGSEDKDAVNSEVPDTKDECDEKPVITDAAIKNEDSNRKTNDDENVDETLDDDEEESEEEESELKKLYPETYKSNEPRLLRTNSQPNSDDEEEEDNDYSPEEDEFKKKIMVGSEYQAQIPEGLCRYDDALPYENEDKLVWDPSQLQECDIESYLQKANIPVIVGSPTSTSPASLPTSSMLTNLKPIVLPNGVHLRDDEGSLFLLLQCGHNTEEALRRRRLNATLPPTAVAATASNQAPIENTLWSEEECRNFESGLRVHGKDFHAIQQSKVRTRSVSELVQFYYLWKKTERHDIFANKPRLEKKKYNLHPGLTDYMDRFLEEQENNGGISINNTSNTITALGSSHGNSNGNEHASRDRSMSPVINSLLYPDFKRQRMSE